MYVTHVHAQKKKRNFNAYISIRHMHCFCFVSYHDAWEARRQLTAAKHGRTKKDQNTRMDHNTQPPPVVSTLITLHHTYLWVMEADRRLDWHVLAWALRSLLRPTRNKERDSLPLVFLRNFLLALKKMFYYWTRQVSYLDVKSVISVCAGDFMFPHHIIRCILDHYCLQTGCHKEILVYSSTN